MPNILVTNTTPGTPVPLSSVAKTVRAATIVACKGLNGPTASPNTGMVRIGSSKTASQQPMEMNPGDERSLAAPANGRLDLSRVFLDVATSGDGVVVDYQ